MKKNMLSKIDRALLSLEKLSPEEIEDYLNLLQDEEKRLSKKRRELHLKIDSCRKAILENLKKQKRMAKGKIFEELIQSLVDPFFKLPEDFLNEEEKNPDLSFDLSKLNFEELENYYNELRREEAVVSFKRRLIQGKIDLLKNWLSLKQSMERGQTDEEFVLKLTKFLSEKGF